MGYRSGWQLAISASTKEKLKEMLDWMDTYAHDISKPEDQREIMEFILSCKETQNETSCIFTEGSTKCYSPWDEVISDISDKCLDDKELDCGYARIGEEYSDIEIWNGDYTFMSISRMIEPADFLTVPIKDKTIVVALPIK